MVRVRPCGATAVLLELASGVSPAGVARLLRQRAQAEGARWRELVPGAATVLLQVPDPDDLDVWRGLIATLPGDGTGDGGSAGGGGGASPVAAGDDGVVEIPVVYDGPDLDMVGGLVGATVEEVIAAHAGARYRAAFCGFAPGFAYLDGLPEELQVPRRDDPRPSVPPGAVAIADRYSAVYPRATPGGWHLLGTTSVRVWDLARTPPALLRPGIPARFVPVPPGPASPEGTSPAGTAAAAPPAAQPVTPRSGLASAWTLIVERPGPLTTVQDSGRPGFADVGVPPSGWLDPDAARLANRLVGNEEGAAVLEITLLGPRLRLTGPAGGVRAVALTGCDAVMRVTVADGRGWDAAPWSRVEVPPDAVVEVGELRGGARGYLAWSGGIDEEPVLGSRSTDLLGGLGPRPLAAGDVVPLGAEHHRRPRVEAVPPPPADPDPLVLRVRPGPRVDWMEDGAWAQLLGQDWVVSPRSNRAGLRLEGPALRRRAGRELPPEGMVSGAVQVPPAGTPVVFLADHPVTGGYPVMAVVDPADLAGAGRARPGTRVRFTAP